jgi:diadenosine tetraphosphatase ApaH/serine/threonine PP2A family protein phosphatase
VKLALLSDVHSNIHALGRALEVLSDLDFDQLAVLGDLVGYAAFPNECVDFFRSLSSKDKPDLSSFAFLNPETLSIIETKLSNIPCHLVVGNHDWAMLQNDYRFMNPVAAAALSWTASVISQPNRDFLAGLGLVKITEGAFIVHGSPDEPEHFIYITNKFHVMQAFELQRQFICFHGHTHIPAIYQLNKNNIDNLSENSELALNRIRRYLINVGSVGQPRDKDPRGALALYDSDAMTYRLIRFDYDVKAAQQSIVDAGLPKLCADRLGWGL